MRNIIIGRIILLLIGITSIIVATYFSQMGIKNIGLTAPSVIISESQINSFTILGYCLISSMCFLGFGITFLKKDN